VYSGERPDQGGGRRPTSLERRSSSFGAEGKGRLWQNVYECVAMTGSLYGIGIFGFTPDVSLMLENEQLRIPHQTWIYERYYNCCRTFNLSHRPFQGSCRQMSQSMPLKAAELAVALQSSSQR
jgi:hypothetical protein